MKKTALLLIAFLGLITSSCSSGSSGNDTSESNMESAEGSAPMYAKNEAYYDMAADDYAATEYEKDFEQKSEMVGKDLKATDKTVSTQLLIKTGNIGFETVDVYEMRGKINALIKQFGAYVSSESEDYYGNRINQYMTVRIPNQYFEPFVDALCDGIERFDNKNIYVEDVTDEFVDTEARIANKKALEQKYIALLEKAHSIEDILEIEKEINYLREDIELAEAHLKNLSSKISYSTLDLYIYQQTSAETHTEEPENRFTLALVGGWEAVVDFFVNLTYAWPAIIICTILFFIARAIWKNKVRPKLFGRD